MKKKDKIEDFMQNFSWKPGPHDLKERILCKTYEKKKSESITPGFRRLLIAGTACLLITIILDGYFSRKNINSLFSQAGVRPAAERALEPDHAAVLAKLLNEPQDSVLIARLSSQLKKQEQTKKDKGYLGDINLFKEARDED